MHRAAHRGLRRILGLALCATMLPTSSAYAWTIRLPELCDTYDWLAHQSVLSAGAHGFLWVDPRVCIEVPEVPKTPSGSAYGPDTNLTEADDAAQEVAELVDQAVEAYERADFAQASMIAGRISDLMADLGDPPFAAGWSIDEPRSIWWRKNALTRTDAYFKSNGWIARRPPAYVADPEAWARALSVRAAAEAPTVEALARDGVENTLPFRRVLAARLDDIAHCTASLFATIEVRAQREMVPARRVSGTDRYATAVAVSQDAYPAGSRAAIVVSGEAWPDGLTAVSLAVLLDAPILLTMASRVPDETLAELARLGARSVTIVGGPAVVDESVVTTLEAGGYAVERIAGSDRYETSGKVAAHARTISPASVGTVYVCTGADFPDALSISQVSGRSGGVILLARPGASSDDIARRVLTSGAADVVVVGGTAAVSADAESALASMLGASAVTRAAGRDRYETAVEILDLRDERSSEPLETVVLASGTSFPDALVGAIIAARPGHGMLLSGPVRLTEPSASAIRARQTTITGLVVLGGESVLGEFVPFDVQRALDPAPVLAPEYAAYAPRDPLRYSPAADVHGPTLGLYYSDLSRFYRSVRTWPTDADGVVMVDYRWFPEPVYNPITVAQRALGAFDEYLKSGSVAARDDFLRQAAWLRDTGMDPQGRYPYAWDYTSRDLTAPWYSAMAQGQAVSALLRAYQLTGDASYLQAARKAFAPFTQTVSEGGVTTVADNDFWPEEYAEARPTQVFNGGVFAMWGLWDLYRVTGDAEARDMFERSCATLLRRLDDYEHEGCVLYERVPGNYCRGYYWLQIAQLRALTDITGDLRFADRGDRWTLMMSDPDSIDSK